MIIINLELSSNESGKKQGNWHRVLHGGIGNNLQSNFIGIMKKTLYRISIKKDGQQWRENIVEINDDEHLKNYFKKMESYGYKIVGIEIALKTQTTI